MTADNGGMTLCLAVNYGGRAEIAEAARRIALDVAGRAGSTADRIDESTFSGYLSTAGMPDPDLLIRTAGELRLSNYLLWQVSYAEFWSHRRPLARLPRRAPARRRSLDYARRQRKFGGLPCVRLPPTG